MQLTPMMQQYKEIKQQYPDALLFFHLGDFYELFFDDAVVAAHVLEIALTGRDAGEAGRIPMCGVPCHAADGYIARLIEKGYRVAICEQVEDPKQARGLVRREVTRVITPGTVVDGQYLDAKRNNYLAAVVPVGEGYGLCLVDVSTGEMAVGEASGERALEALRDELACALPAEVLVPDNTPEALLELVRRERSVLVTRIEAEDLTEEAARRAVQAQFGDGVQTAPWWQRRQAVLAAGAALRYLTRTQKRELAHIRTVAYLPAGRFLLMDAATRRNLEVTRSLLDGGKWGTLLWVLDHTVTPMGGRCLARWLEMPLTSPAEIGARHGAVQALADDTLVRAQLRKKIGGIQDLERLAARIAYGTATARDMVALKVSLRAVPPVREMLSDFRDELLVDLCGRLDPLEDVADLLERALVDDPPVGVRDGGLIRDGYNAEVDRLRSVGSEGRDWLCAFEAQERERTNIRSLKVGYNRVFGYYIEVTKPNLHLVPPDYKRRQTLANAERFTTEALKQYEDRILAAEERLAALEYELFLELRQKVVEQLERLQRTARAVAQLDALQSLAEAAARYGYVRPTVTTGQRIAIADGRHPVLERVLAPGTFVPNDTLLDEERRLVILTGPNMAGKSTYMRQVALLVLMAQAGSLVPAARAEIGVVDRIFARVGASDNLAGGQSTFMVEMSECRTIIENATPASLVILDEVGRGTSTYDGMSLARAIVEYLHTRTGARTLFSTHYHELTDLAALPGAANYTITVKEEGDAVIFLHRVVPGSADKSYGLHVARLAGLPTEVIERAREVLSALEVRGHGSETVRAPRPVVQLAMFGPALHPVLEELKELDLTAITPLEALNRLYDWQQRLAGDRWRESSGRRQKRR
ncbi:MAG: DNA mismatch repair protein MutS [Desulfotomaculales bacterium]